MMMVMMMLLMAVDDGNDDDNVTRSEDCMNARPQHKELITRNPSALHGARPQHKPPNEVCFQARTHLPLRLQKRPDLVARETLQELHRRQVQVATMHARVGLHSESASARGR